jgi:hypothetical protein
MKSRSEIEKKDFCFVKLFSYLGWFAYFMWWNQSLVINFLE